MSLTKKLFRRDLVLTAGLALAAIGGSADAQIKNGAFEKGGSGIAPPHWTEVGGVRQNPPEGAGMGGPGNNSAVITTGFGVSLSNGMRGAAVGQTFPCGPFNPQATCFVRFLYAYDEQPANSSSKAFVYMNGAFGPRIADLPDNTPPGPQAVQIGYPGCGPMVIKFGVIEPNGEQTFVSTLLVDRVKAMCDNQPWPQTPTLEMHPFSGDGPVGELLDGLCKKMGPWQDLGQGHVGGGGLVPILEGSGPLAPGSVSTLTLTDAIPNSFLILVVGLDDANVPLLGGTLVPTPDLFLTVAKSEGQILTIANDQTLAALTGQELYFQAWVKDAAASFGYSATNGLRGTVASAP